MNFSELIQWLIGSDGGAFIVVAWAISWGLEGWSVWDTLESKLKSLIILGVSIVIGLFFVWLNTQPGIIAAVEPYMNTVIYIIAVWLATQTAHRLDNLRK